MKNFARTIALASVLGAPLHLFAEDEGGVSTFSHPAITSPREPKAFSFLDDTLTFDLYERVRWEDRNNNYDFDRHHRALTDDNWALLRFRLGMQWKPTSWFRFYVQGQDAREWLSDRSDFPGISGAEGDNTFDLRQAYVEIGDIGKFPLILKAGRQTMEYGDERLIGRSTWNNFGRTFDAVKLAYVQPTWRLDAFASSVVVIRRGEFDKSDLFDGNEVDRQQIFSGLYFTHETRFGLVDLYGLWLSQANGNNANTAGNLPDVKPKGDDRDAQHTSFGTYGGRLRGDPKKLHGFEWEVEGAYQNGEVRDLALSAFAIHGGLGYNLDRPWKLRLWAEYNFATGDEDRTDQSSQTFQNLFPSNHRFYGYMDLFSWQNIHNPEVSFRLQPHKNVSVQLDYHGFWLATNEDAWYRNNGVTNVRPLNAKASNASTFVGTEIDFTVTWKVNKHLDLQTGYSHFFSGDYIRQTGPHSDADFGYVMATFNL
jgi:hypothetical protein